MAAFATSYIPTLAASVTRSADVASVNTLSPWFNATEGTIYTEASYSSESQLSTVYLGDGTTNNGIWVGKSVGGSGATSAELYVRSGGANQGFPVSVSGVIGSTYVKIAACYKANDFRIAAQGTIGSADLSGSVPTCNQMLIGDYLYTSAKSQHIKRIAYYPRALTNAELAALTA
jgi:hypothetical protein